MDYTQRLTDLRNDRDVNQEIIAKIIGCQQSAVSKYERGINKYKIDDIIKLCLFYNVSADYILGLPKGMPYPERQK